MAEQKMEDKAASHRAVTVSVCMIVRDEEPVLARCLKGVVQFADELVIVDTGSVDNTRRIAADYTEKVYDYPWHDDFAAARNYAYDRGTCDYLMWVDADDVVPPADIARIQAMKAFMPSDADVVLFTYTSDPDDRDIYGGGTIIRDRLIRRRLNPRWRYPVHESVSLRPEWKRYYRPDIRILHQKAFVNDAGRNLRIFENALAHGWRMDDNNLAYYCRELMCADRFEEAVSVFDRLWMTGDEENISYALLFYIESMKALNQHEALADRLVEYGQRFGLYDLALCTLADERRRQGTYEEAILLYRQAMDAPVDLKVRRLYFSAYHDFLPWLGMCKAYFHLERYPEGMDCLLRAEQIHPTYPEVKILKLYTMLSTDLFHASRDPAS